MQAYNDVCDRAVERDQKWDSTREPRPVSRLSRYDWAVLSATILLILFALLLQVSERLS